LALSNLWIETTLSLFKTKVMKTIKIKEQHLRLFIIVFALAMLFITN